MPRNSIRFRSRILLAASCVAYVCFAACTQTYSAERPSILLIMADDLGYSDLGCYGSEIETPNLDQLAANGLQFTQFYNTGRCWPTRGSLLTGYYAQQIRRDTLPGIPSGGRGVRPEWAKLLPVLLKPQGYRSYHTGKWHIDGMPLENGFERSYYLKDQGRFFNPKVHWKDDEKLPPVEPNSGFYATTALADHVIECLEEHSSQYAAQPFLHYLAFAAPHFPLHALPEDIVKYRDRYLDGWEKARAARFKRISERGIVASELSEVEREVGPPYHFPDALEKLGAGEVNRPLPWDSLTTEQRRFQATKMAIHAAMVDRVDQELGRVFAQLRKMKAFDNTLIFFLSDNGASAEIMVRDDGHDPSAAPGSAATYLCLGPGWSNCSNTPFRRHKTWVHEGGIATPLIAHWPQGIQAQGELRMTPGHVIDIVPTILQVAGASRPAVLNDALTPEPPGTSLVPAFANDKAIDRDYLWWLHEGNRAIRVGDWKLVAAKDEPWALFDLSSDRTETTDLAAMHPKLAKELAELWEQHFNEFVVLASKDVPPTTPTKKRKKR